MNTAEKPYPETLAEAVEILRVNMNMNEEFFLAYMDAQELADLHLSLGPDIRDDFGLNAGNEALVRSCREFSGQKDLPAEDASMVILRCLWQRVRKENRVEDL